ncbi:MAG: DUF1552 domain-containing protein [Myxococcales bacterium]|nr:DUF1552 domain-containing protein [Myxococcales bacterium]
MRSRSIPRRTVLRGLLGAGSVALGLPLLEAMLDSHGEALADGAPLPLRFGVWFWGNGTQPGAWAPQVQGAGWEATGLLAGLAPVKEHVSVISGGNLPVLKVRNPHAEGAVGILAGGNPLLHPSYNGQNNDWDFLTVPSASVDQIAADHLAGSSPFRSLVLAITPVHTSDAGSINAPGTAISYISHPAPYVFNPPIMDPSELFAALFGVITPGEIQPAALARARVLDAIKGDAADLRTRLGKNDRSRLDQHLEGVHELQNRLTAMVMGGESCVMPVDPGNPESERLRARAMAELTAMAFACDLSRVVSLEFSSPASHVDYPDIGITGDGLGTSFHEYEHQKGYDANVLKGLGYFVEVFGDFVAALGAIPEAGGTLLDRSCIFGTSDVAGGWNHAMNDFPLLVAGRAGGALVSPGVHVALGGDKATRVPFTCLKAVGAPVTSFGGDQLATDQVVAELLV